MKLINENHHPHRHLGYRIKHSDIVLLSDEEFTQNISATLHHFTDSEWNLTIRYIY